MERIGGGRRCWAVLAGLIVVAGCGGTPVTPPGTAPGSASSVPSGAATSAPPTTAQAWDLVWFSDSSIHGAAQPYAAKIQERLGVTVRLHDFGGSGAHGSASFIAELLDLQAVSQAIQEAEAIVLYTNPARTAAGDAVAAACMEGVKDHPPKLYTAADFKEFADVLRSIYEQIFEIRSGKTVALRAVDLYVPVLAGWTAAGVERECTADWETWTSVLRSVAAEWDVPVASMYEAFNGPKHDQDPKEKGLISSDGVHPSEAGTALEVATLDALGYEPITGQARGWIP